MNIRVSPRNGDQKRVGGFERVVETGKPSVFEVDTSLWWPGKTLNLGICPDREARLWGGTRYPASVSRLAAFGATPPSLCIAAKDRFPHAERTSGVGHHLFDSPGRLLSRTGGKSAIIPGAPRSAALAPSNRPCQQYPAGRSPFPVHRIASSAGQNPEPLWEIRG